MITPASPNLKTFAAVKDSAVTTATERVLSSIKEIAVKDVATPIPAPINCINPSEREACNDIFKVTIVIIAATKPSTLLNCEPTTQAVVTAKVLTKNNCSSS